MVFKRGVAINCLITNKYSPIKPINYIIEQQLKIIKSKIKTSQLDKPIISKNGKDLSDRIINSTKFWIV